MEEWKEYENNLPVKVWKVTKFDKTTDNSNKRNDNHILLERQMGGEKEGVNINTNGFVPFVTVFSILGNKHTNKWQQSLMDPQKSFSLRSEPR